MTNISPKNANKKQLLFVIRIFNVAAVFVGTFLIIKVVQNILNNASIPKLSIGFQQQDIIERLRFHMLSSIRHYYFCMAEQSFAKIGLREYMNSCPVL